MSGCADVCFLSAGVEQKTFSPSDVHVHIDVCVCVCVCVSVPHAQVQEGGWGAFSKELNPEGITARCAFKHIKDRHRDLIDLEARLRDVHELFLLMAVMVDEQGVMLKHIAAH